jgi:hypothetical protein
MKLIKETYVSWNAEVIFITSNWQGNKDMMEGCKAAGIPAFVRLSSSKNFPFPDVVDLGNALGLLRNSVKHIGLVPNSTTSDR